MGKISSETRKINQDRNWCPKETFGCQSNVMMGISPLNLSLPLSVSPSQQTAVSCPVSMIVFDFALGFLVFLSLISERKAVQPNRLSKELKCSLPLLGLLHAMPAGRAAWEEKLAGVGLWSWGGGEEKAGRQGARESDQPRWGRGRANEKHMPPTILRAGLIQAKWWIARMRCIHSWGAGRNSLARGLGGGAFFPSFKEHRTINTFLFVSKIL